MTSPPNHYQRSIHRLLLVIVFLLGVCVILLGDIANATRGFNTVFSGIGKLIGGFTALGALIALYKNVVPLIESSDTSK